MKFSKFASTAAIIVLLFGTFAFRSLSNEDPFLEVYFSNKLDISNLAKIQSDLLKKDIKLNYDYLKFGKDGKLEGIKYNVFYKRVGGSDETTDTHTEIGFIIDTAPNPKYGIIVGEKDKIQKQRISMEEKK